MRWGQGKTSILGITGREKEKEEKEEPMKETGEGRRWQTNMKATGVETFKEIISSFHSDFILTKEKSI